jgi:hypothetical protein
VATATSSLPQHEQPPVANVRLWAGVLLAPAAWTVAELLGYFLVARACDRDPPSGVAHAGITQDVVAVLLGVIAVAGLVLAISNLRSVGDVGDREMPGVPTARGRARFMSLAGVVMSSLFVLGIVFFALPPLFVNWCNQAR